MTSLAAWTYIEPDRFDIDLILEGKLRGCPFCGNVLPSPINRVHQTTGIYRSLISCSKCDTQVGYNARDLDEARNAVIKRWNTRVME